MKYTVLNEFIDRHTRKYHAPGSEYETNNTEWAKYLIEGGFLKGEVKKTKSRVKKNEDK